MYTSISMHRVVSVQDRIKEQYREMTGDIFYVRHFDIEFEDGTSEYIALYAKEEKSLVSWDKKPLAPNIQLEASIMVQAVPDAGLPKYREDLLAQISYVDDKSAEHSARMIEYIKAIDRRLVVV
jgi:hypothetical protein